MRGLIYYTKKNALLKIASLNTLAVSIKMITGFLTAKAIAIFIGPEGMTLTGNLRNFVYSLQSVSSLGLYEGMVKYTAELKEKSVTLNRMLSTYFFSILLVSLTLSVLCFTFAPTLNRLIFDQRDFGYIFKLVSFSIPFYALYLFLLSILNGLKRHKLFLTINVWGWSIGLLSTLLLIWLKNLEGALIAVVTTPVLLMLVTLSKSYRLLKDKIHIDISKFKGQSLKKLTPYALMALLSATAIPLTTLAIRNYLIDHSGVVTAGYWEGMNRISSHYLLFIHSLISLYLLPKLSETSTDKGFRKAVFSFYRHIIPLFCLGLTAIYLFRNLIIQVLFTDAFFPMESLFIWQLTGDFFKVLGLVIAYQLIAKKMFFPYIITEGISISLCYITSVYWINLWGAEGAVIAHLFTAVIDFFIILAFFRKPLLRPI